MTIKHGFKPLQTGTALCTALAILHNLRISDDAIYDQEVTDTDYMYDDQQARDTVDTSIQENHLYTFNRTADVGNPLIGFSKYYPNRGYFTEDRLSPWVPFRLENFYVTMRSVMQGWNSFTFDDVESKLESIASRNHTAIFRIYMVWPGKTMKKTDAVPDFLIDGGLAFHEFSEGVSPDWGDSNLLAAMIQLIEEMGKRYDADSRVANINVGFLGNWGEWHGQKELAFASIETQKEILEAFSRSFKVTQLSVRYADRFGGLQPGDTRFGYHDDSFAKSTSNLRNESFVNRIIRAGATEQWKVGSIGGELRPELQDCLFDDDDWMKVCDFAVNAPAPPVRSCKGCPYQSFETNVNLTHASWMWNNKFHLYDEAAAARAISAVASMGYKFYLRKVVVIREGSELKIRAKVQNLGVAPFYYPVELQIQVGAASATLGSLQTLLPDEEVTLRADLVASGDTAFLSLRSAWAPTGVRFAIAEQQSEQHGVVGVSLALPVA